MKNDLYELFQSVGVYKHHVAGVIFIDALTMILEKPDRLMHMTRDIYIPIAEKRGTTAKNVSKNLRDVRDTIMKHGGATLLQQMTGQTCWFVNPPYPNELLRIFARYIKLHHLPYHHLYLREL
ncbi:MAG: hypothetical protein HFI63_08325 [Lachnospiraceae bacterium]|nr:hypothetical protein [Lachnospiraceae bacterium]